MLLSLDFLAHQPALQLRSQAGQTWVFDPIRRKEVVLTPEELLRQLVVQYLLREKNYPAAKMRVEYGIVVNGLRKRCDVVIFDEHVSPWLIVECKSPKIPIGEQTFRQVATYNLPYKAPYIAVTNGLTTVCSALHHTDGTFTFLPDFPDWGLEHI